VTYFAGFIFKKIISFHKCADCEKCSKHVKKMTASVDTIDSNELFLWLKRYDDRKLAIRDI